MRGVGKKRFRQRLQSIKLVHEIEGAAPFLGRIEKIGDSIIDLALWKTLARPLHRALNEVEGGNARASVSERLGVVAKTAADVERAKPGDRTSGEPLFEKRTRLEICPRHAGRIALSERVDSFEPFAALGISLDPSRALMRIDGVKLFARSGAARREIFATLRKSGTRFFTQSAL